MENSKKINTTDKETRDLATAEIVYYSIGGLILLTGIVFSIFGLILLNPILQVIESCIDEKVKINLNILNQFIYMENCIIN